jgi:hypothetical protein
MLRWIICEDGTEYWQRFQRFLGVEFALEHVQNGQALLDALATRAAGVILDQDFRRTDAADLLDEQGRTDPARSPEQAAQLIEAQGTLILRALRAAGCQERVLLCADLDPQQRAFIERTYPPTTVVDSHQGLAQIAALMR